ncbi:MAG: DUF4255 domain-containing protein [Pseudomonadota bacterium]
MIHKALDILRAGVATFLKKLPDLNVSNDTVVVLSPIVKTDGSSAVQENTLALTLVNIEEERIARSPSTVSIDTNGRVSHRNPEIRLNLYLMVTSHFKDYKTALEFLSATIRFFQSKNVFTPENTPGLDSTIEKLLVELYTMDFEQQNHLWATLGGKYIPSVIYRVRMLILQESQKIDEQPQITTITFASRGI